MLHTRIAVSGLLAVAGLAAAGPGTSPADPVETFTIAESPRGAPIGVWRLGNPEPDDLGRGPDERPALLIVAGLNGRHDFGTRLALTLTDRLLTEHGDLLDRFTVYIVPDMNPDNDSLFDRAGVPRADFGRAPQSADADGDGRADEDGAEDLNGDGMITMMRVKDPAPGSGLRATLVLDDDPRLLREPDGDEGEQAEYALLIEGIDNDGDGQFNEDGFAGGGGAGVDLDKNFPSLWPEHEDGSGDYQLSRPETRGLVEWLMQRDNIICALTYTPYDNILNTPETGQNAPDGREPRGIEEGDKDVYDRVQEIFKEVTAQTEAPAGEWGGSFTHYAYAHLGVWSFATPAWVRPDQVERGGDDEEADDAEQAGEAANPGARGGRDPEAERRALQERGVPAFVIDFITMSAAERASTMEEFNELPPAEQAARMEAVAALPEDVQLRVRALISGQPDPGAQSSGGGATGGPPRGQPEGRASGGRGGRPGAGGGRGGRAGGGGSRGGADAPAGDEAKWIAYSDEHLDGEGFVEWTEIEHPQLGTVEVGGLVPGIRHEPPESEWSRIADEQTEFIAQLLGLMPSLEVSTTSVERVTDGIWRIRVRATNPGDLPTRAAIGVKARRLTPIVLRLGVEPDSLLSGSVNTSWDSIDGKGAFEETEWLVKAADGSTIPLEIRSSVFGDRTLNIELKEGE